MSAIHEVQYFIHGHAAGRDAFFVARRKGDLWAVLDNKAGGQQDFWTGSEWLPLKGDEPDMLVFRFTAEQAERDADHFATWASQAHTRAHTMGNRRFAAWLAGETEHYVAQVREAVGSC